MSERASRRLVVILASVVMLALVLFVFVVLPSLAGERRVRGFCADVQAGVTWPALAMAAGAQGLRVVAPDDSRPALITDQSAFFGRSVCEVGVGSDGRVLASRFYRSD